MLTIDWRSPAIYNHTGHIPVAGFAWNIFVATTSTTNIIKR